jgi:hypothetical protein
MTFGDLISFEEVATLGGGATTLGNAVTPTLRRVAVVGGKSGWPAMMAVSWHKAIRCFNLALTEVGTVCLSCLIRLTAVSMERSCSNVTRTWQCVGYRRHVLEKRKHCVAGI